MASNSAKKLGANQRRQWLETLTQNGVKLEVGTKSVLIDTNVWYSAILYGGKPEDVVRFCKQNCRIVSSRYLLNELLDLLKEIKSAYRWRNNLEKLLRRTCTFVEPPDFSGISRDPKDDPIIAAAIAGACDYLITNDQDLLELGGYKNMRIITASDFLDLLSV